MKRIGIILESTDCGKYLYETVSELAKSNQVEIFFLLNDEGSNQGGIWNRIKGIVKNEGIRRAIDRSFFFFVSTVEYKVLCFWDKNFKNHKKIYNIDEFNKKDTTYLSPIFSSSGFFVHYSGEDIDKIKSLNLDIIIRGNAPGIFRGDVVSSAKEGILSFHHGDNRWNRGGPPAFWEVYLKKSSTGFIIQRLTEVLDGGQVLFRGDIMTGKTYTENLINLFDKSNSYLTELVLKYATSNQLPAPEENLPFGGALLKAPSFHQTVRYLLNTFFLFFLLIFRRFVLRKEYRWGVGFINSSWENAILRSGVRIKNLPRRFFSDPFVVKKNDRTICFVENYSFKQKRGCITAIEIFNEKEYKILGTVIEEHFHISFPYIFEYENNLYMIPETGDINSIRLYKCMEFPMRWEYQRDILTGRPFRDTMLFQYDRKWYLLTNLEDSSVLIAYYNDNPITGEWIKHEKNPLIFDSNISRNGGILYGKNGGIVRCRQKQDFNQYGASLSLAEITELTPSSFKEQEICKILPNFLPKIKGCHHIHSNGDFTVFDYVHVKNLR